MERSNMPNFQNLLLLYYLCEMFVRLIETRETWISRLLFKLDGWFFLWRIPILKIIQYTIYLVCQSINYALEGMWFLRREIVFLMILLPMSINDSFGPSVWLICLIFSVIFWLFFLLMDAVILVNIKVDYIIVTAGISPRPANWVLER